MVNTLDIGTLLIVIHSCNFCHMSSLKKWIHPLFFFGNGMWELCLNHASEPSGLYMGEKYTCPQKGKNEDDWDQLFISKSIQPLLQLWTLSQRNECFTHLSSVLCFTRKMKVQFYVSRERWEYEFMPTKDIPWNIEMYVS